jgi:beta-glucosidase
MPWVDDVKGIIHHHFPGQESGSGLADIVFGDKNPSGRLPYTIAKNLHDYPYISPTPAYDYGDNYEYMNQPMFIHDVNYTDGNFIDYKYFDFYNVEPLFPFGHGLSYTKFEYSDINAKVIETGKTPEVVITVSITNIGGISGWEVPQLYLGFPDVADQPIRNLRGFHRIHIPSGESRSAAFKLGFDELSHWDQQYTVAKGQYKVWVGASSRDLRITGSFSI